MEFLHTPVLFRETLEMLDVKAGGSYADGTLGGGGHAAAICGRLGEAGLLLGIDRDPDAIQAARAHLEKFPCKKRFIHGNFRNIRDILEETGIEGLDGAVLDLGVSSFQLDNAKRGFSYMADAPLDMRMDADGGGLTAEDVVNRYSEAELTHVIRSYGEERWSARISSFIVRERKKKRIQRTGDLVEIIKAAIPAAARREGPHPAKRSFQALRIEVNDEIGGLEEGLEAFVECLNPGGRLCVISFHSLEDRVVKNCFAKHEAPCGCPKDLPMCVCGKTPDGRRVTRKPVCPSEEETESNPRSRSAKLRVMEKLQ
ncbi:MAG: 16S rRNA (cytosine(1402)-N(4))-methyltransferase RsmH [Clostridiales Family XIII bacterium]|jgi:16S rRNA (cytosine1402-N4)-methyltransferase|nr:16S rRNA (cytosine(1402)-N(4))-methyltransferase RsmH [Clostridiales Family XIII bacterium]